MIDKSIKNELMQITGPQRYVDRPEELICYAYDASDDGVLPDVVLFPQTAREISQILTIASRHNIPVTSRGAGTSLCGASVPVQKGIVICFTKMDQILEVNTPDRYIVVQPGVVNTDVQKALAPFRFFFPPDPSSMPTSTIGGNIAMNAGGPRCLKYGVTADYVLGLEVVLASGEIIRFGSRNVKDVTGYKLSSLFCGSEGTLGIITEAILKVVPLPESAKALMVVFSELEDSARAVSDIIGSGIIPVAMELMDKTTLNLVEDTAMIGMDRDSEGALLIEVNGSTETCEREMALIIQKLQENGAVFIHEAPSDAEREKLWAARRAAYGAFAKLAPDIISEDVTVPVSKVPQMVRKMVAIAQKYNLPFGVAAHAGDGNMHPIIPGDRQNKAQWRNIEAAFSEMFHAAVELNGTLSGEHGIGFAKARFLPLVMNDDTIRFMKTIKQAVDPDGILNPGKFV